MTFKVEYIISDERVRDLLLCGMEGDIRNFTIVGATNVSGGNLGCKYPYLNVPFKGGTILLRDKYGNSPNIHELNAKSIEKGLKVLSVKYPFLWNDFMNDHEDAVTGDAFVQCCVFGEIIYG